MSSREPIWARPEPASGRAGHSRADIAAAAVRVADAEGLEAVSMRRVAKELGAGTMSLYHYVRDKDDLFDLMGDLVLRRVPRRRRRARPRLARRPGRDRPRDPRHAAQPPVAAAAGHGARRSGRTRWPTSSRPRGPRPRPAPTPPTYMEFAGLLDEYVFGCLTRETSHGPARAPGRPRLLAVADRQRRVPAHRGASSTRTARPAADPGDLARNSDADGRFERGLQRVLDGIAAELARGR